MEVGLSLVFWLPLGTLFLTLDCLAQPEDRGHGWLYGSSMCHALLVPMGDLHFFEEIQSKS